MRREAFVRAQAAGGFSSVAQQLGFQSRRRPVGYWEDKTNLDLELEWFVSANWTEHMEPDSGDVYFYNAVRPASFWFWCKCLQRAVCNCSTFAYSGSSSYGESAGEQHDQRGALDGLTSRVWKQTGSRRLVA